MNMRNLRRGIVIWLLLLDSLGLIPAAYGQSSFFPPSPPPVYPPVVPPQPPYRPIPPQAPSGTVPETRGVPNREQREQGVLNPRTGEFFPGTYGGVIDPRTGVLLPKVDGGYVDPRTGEVIPGRE